MHSWQIVALLLVLLAANAEIVKFKNSGLDYDLGVIVEYQIREFQKSLYYTGDNYRTQTDILYRHTCWVKMSNNIAESISIVSSERLVEALKVEAWIRPLNTVYKFNVIEELYQKPTNRCVEFKGNSAEPLWNAVPCDTI